MNKLITFFTTVLISFGAIAGTINFQAFIIQTQDLEKQLNELVRQERTSSKYSLCALFLDALADELEDFRDDLAELNYIEKNNSQVIFHGPKSNHYAKSQSQFDLSDTDSILNYLKRAECKNPQATREISARIQLLKQNFINQAAR